MNSGERVSFCPVCGYRFLWCVAVLVVGSMLADTVRWPRRSHTRVCCPECQHDTWAQWTSRSVLEIGG